MTQIANEHNARGHFRARVGERLSPNLDGDALFDAIRSAIERGETDVVAFVGRLSRDGRRLFAFKSPHDRGLHFAIVDTAGDRPLPITILSRDLMEDYVFRDTRMERKKRRQKRNRRPLRVSQEDADQMQVISLMATAA